MMNDEQQGRVPRSTFPLLLYLRDKFAKGFL
jgi:hypothetical protein